MKNVVTNLNKHHVNAIFDVISILDFEDPFDEETVDDLNLITDEMQATIDRISAQIGEIDRVNSGLAEQHLEAVALRITNPALRNHPSLVERTSTEPPLMINERAWALADLHALITQRTLILALLSKQALAPDIDTKTH